MGWLFGVGDGRASVGVRGVGLVMVGLVVVLAGCTDGRGEPVTGSVVGGTGTTAPGEGTTVDGELAGRQQARLDVVSGATTVVVRAAELGDRLFRASAPAGSSIEPVATVDGDLVRVSVRGSGTGGQGPSEMHIEVNAGVSWELRLDGGATQESVDMTGGRLAALDFGAGSARIEVTLPRPAGTVPVRMSGGATTFDVHLPSGVAAQVLVAGGASHATIDGVTHTGIAGGTLLPESGTAAPAWDSATDRYRIELTAGVSAFTLDRVV